MCECSLLQVVMISSFGQFFCFNFEFTIHFKILKYFLCVNMGTLARLDTVYFKQWEKFLQDQIILKILGLYVSTHLKQLGLHSIDF
jgi:hypothetical protein